MSQKPLDRVNEAFKGELGKDFSDKTRNRINWIVNQVKGIEILDIGCSQGIIPIILGREGKVIDALDIAEESIEYAKNDLKNEHLSVQENVNFRVSNFMTEKDLKNEYDTILLTEVLEHISDTEMFLEKIHRLLSNEGRLVITVPFGINDYFDHKRTYYFLELYDQVSKYFCIEKFHYLGKWVGIVCYKDEINHFKQDTFSREQVESLEHAFYTVERDFLNRIESYQDQVNSKNENIKILTNKIKDLENLKEKKLESYKTIQSQLEHKLEELRRENASLKVQLKECLESEEKTLKMSLREKDEIEKLTIKVKNLEKKYDLLRKSKLGNITLKYWEIRRKLKNKGK